MWFNGRIGVSKTFDVGSIPTTPAKSRLRCNSAGVFVLYGKEDFHEDDATLYYDVSGLVEGEKMLYSIASSPYEYSIDK